MRAKKQYTIALAFSLIALSGCTSTPQSGPGYRAVESNAAVTVSSSNKTVGIDYALVDINKAVLAYAADTRTVASFGSFGAANNVAPNIPLGVGDVVQVSIFESQQGGLFIPADAGSRPGNFVTLPSQTIGRNGSISVPYAGLVRASGRQTIDVQRDIEKTLANRAIEPQVLVNKVTSRSARAAVLGDVRAPAKIELSEGGDRILDVISQAGGLSSPGSETYVTLQRQGRSATVLYQRLVNTPSENVFVAPNDTIIVDRERRTYLAFGASGLNGRFDFEETDLTLGEALGKAGGLLDSRANPAQVLVYRVVPKQFLRNLAVNVDRFPSDMVPVVFRANVRDPSAFFAVQKFPMQDKDVLYVSNSDSVEIIKFLNLLNSVTSTVSGVSGDAAATKTNIQRLN